MSATHTNAGTAAAVSRNGWAYNRAESICGSNCVSLQQLAARHQLSGHQDMMVSHSFRWWRRLAKKIVNKGIRLFQPSVSRP
jgi:hypothetical protein